MEIMWWEMLRVMGLAFIQITVYAMVSRARNRNSRVYHLIVSSFSHLIFFLTFRELVLGEMSLQLIIPYCVGAVSGSLFGAELSRIIEERIGAKV